MGIRTSQTNRVALCESRIFGCIVVVVGIVVVVVVVVVFVVGVCLHLASILKFCMSMCRFGGACAVLIIDIFPAYIFVCC